MLLMVWVVIRLLKKVLFSLLCKVFLVIWNSNWLNSVVVVELIG